MLGLGVPSRGLSYCPLNILRATTKQTHVAGHSLLEGSRRFVSKVTSSLAGVILDNCNVVDAYDFFVCSLGVKSHDPI